ncbi:uncharacterized protein (DUF427 family) [Mycolicibacterium iranicum]|uniref:Uncharacterized protein (DUF427 family) n=1 Tax=Mycolicibacterium iranicum TaxID=912594 RepID=A0A839Q6Q5_MYCIR|nr:DUF427 domain-containing protein [Mycolicibacterium iranicum]MBB2990045.1 uncharacterized protein (DUF427 family) [Mycolicibacterium iranicum]
MSLVAGSGPLSRDRAGQLTPPATGDLVYIEPHPRRIQALVDGHPVIDTERALMVHRQGHPLAYAFSVEDVGELPSKPVPEAPGYCVVPWSAVDTWFEEGRRLVHYPPNPYHRVDCRPTGRGLRVSVGDTVLVDTVDTVILFETALRPRLYVAPSTVRTDLLQRSETSSYCNYKGYATYWHAVTDGVVIEDAAWSYEEPLPESTPIKGLLSFDETKVDVLAELPASASYEDCGCQV